MIAPRAVGVRVQQLERNTPGRGASGVGRPDRKAAAAAATAASNLAASAERDLRGDLAGGRVEDVAEPPAGTGDGLAGDEMVHCGGHRRLLEERFGVRAPRAIVQRFWVGSAAAAA